MISKSYQLSVPPSPNPSSSKTKTPTANSVPPKKSSILPKANLPAKERKSTSPASKLKSKNSNNKSNNTKKKSPRPRKPLPRRLTPPKMYPFYKSSELKFHHIRLTSTFNRVGRSKRRQNQFVIGHDQSTSYFNLSSGLVPLDIKDRLKLSITSSNWSIRCSQQFTVTWCTALTKNWTFLKNIPSMSILELSHQKKTGKIVFHGRLNFYPLFKWTNTKDSNCWNWLPNTLAKSTKSKTLLKALNK